MRRSRLRRARGFNTIFVFKNEADIERLLEGWRKAGMPELPPDIDPKSKDRLTAAEMKSLVFGHELRGRRTAPEVARISAHHRNRWFDHGHDWYLDRSRNELDASRRYLRRLSQRIDRVWCHLPQSGRYTREASNEYQFVFHWARFEFSVVE